MEKYFKVHNYPIPPKTKCTRIVKPESYYLLYKHNFTISQIKDILKKHNISSGKSNN